MTPGQEKYQLPYATTGYETWSPKPRDSFKMSFSVSRKPHFGGGGKTWQNCGLRHASLDVGDEHGTSLFDGQGADRTRGLAESESKLVWSSRSVKEMAEFGTIPSGLPRGLTRSEKQLWIAIYVKAKELLQGGSAPTVRTAVDRAVLDVTGSIAGHDDGAGRKSIEYRFAMRWSHSVKTCLAMRSHFRSGDLYS